MARIYASLIMKGLKTLSDIPKEFVEEVKKILKDKEVSFED